MPKLFALSDPHLSFASEKPMGVFGSRWEDHAAKLETNWRQEVGENDLVLMPGDISWAMRLGEARPDLEWLAALPGRKVLLRGNHDYWWESLGKMRALGLPGLFFLQNNQVNFPGLSLGGTRLWDFPGIRWEHVSNHDNPEVAEDKRATGQSVHRGEDAAKIRERELGRLRLSLGGLRDDGSLRVCLLHYPPLSGDGRPTDLTDLLGSFKLDLCVFGHVHALVEKEHPGADVVIGGTRYILASSDFLLHRPKFLLEWEE